MVGNEVGSPRGDTQGGRRDSLSSVRLGVDPSGANWPETKNDTTRSIHLLQSEMNHAKFKYCGNTIKTSKYTILTFLPKNLFEQFRRYANFYFLCIAILQLVPGLSPVLPITTILPLVMVLSFTGMKEAFEDYKRHRSDKTVNNQSTLILRDGVLKPEAWADVRVGDVVKLTKNQACPSDMIILSTAKAQGMCYIETMSLDGETNLKTRQALEETAPFTTVEQISDFCDGASIECEKPNSKLYHFEGSLRFEGRIVALNNKQIMLRECYLRNTDWVFGLVIFTGHDTKLMMNAMEIPSKRSSVELRMNLNVIFVFAMMLTFCIASTVGSYLWMSEGKTKAWYLALAPDFSVGLYAFKQFWGFVILFNVLIPISLYVSVEFVKIAQKQLIDWDEGMYHEETDTFGEARTSNLSEELGQVDHIFSDKTGTLTCNIMEFLKCTIAGRTYGRATTEIGRHAAAEMGVHVPETEEDAAKGHTKNWHFDDGDLSRDLKNPKYQPRIELFLKMMALCHTVVPEIEDGILGYQASSPDEGALVEAAAHLGMSFTDRTMRTLTLDNFGTKEEYGLLNVLEFNSERKRMSIVIRTPAPENKILILTKGADTVVFPLLREGEVSYGKTTLRHLEAFAAEGLRTLVLAYAEVSEEQYESWATRFHDANVALLERQARVDKVAAELEQDLTLLGGTAIEDKLQKGVPSAIANLKAAGIKVWVLTGDKQETAINIGFACALLRSNMDLHVINATSVASARMQLLERKRELLDPKKGVKESGLIIDGHTLDFVLENDKLSHELLEVATMCASVVCCRVSPIQKANIVGLVRDNRKTTTLAIGDGANDVSMITRAHIGVGISGQEGMQAVLASDYSIAQFRFLERLLLIHGRWSYYRIVSLILYSFYKNFTFCLTQFWFQLFCGFSGQTLLDSWYITTYNMFWTSCPILVVAVFDQDVSAASCIEFPYLYVTGQTNARFRTHTFLLWLLDGVYQSFVCFAVPMMVYGGKQSLRADGTMDGIWALGTLVYSCVVCVVNARVAMLTSHWTFVHVLCMVASVALYFTFVGIYSLIGSDFGANVFGLAAVLYATPSLILCICVCCTLCLLPGVVLRYAKRYFFPEKYHIIQEMEKFHVPYINQRGETHSMKRNRAVSSVDPAEVDRLPKMEEELTDLSEEELSDDVELKAQKGDKVKLALLTIRAVHLMQNGQSHVCRGYNMAQDPGEGPLIVDNERSVIFRPKNFSEQGEDLSDHSGFEGHSSDEHNQWDLPVDRWYEPKSVRDKAALRGVGRGTSVTPLYGEEFGANGHRGPGPTPCSPPYDTDFR